MHWGCFRQIKYLEMQANVSKMVLVKASAQKAAFADTVRNLASQATQKDKAEALGLNEPLYAEIPEAQVKEKITFTLT